MQRITDTTAGASLPAPPALTGTTGYFVPAVPGVSAATKFRYWFANVLQEELMSILAAASIAADTTGTVFNQVLLSIQALIAAIPHGVQAFSTSGTFTVPTGVTQLEVEVWGGGSGSWASISGLDGAGGSGGGHARKRLSGLTPGATITVTVGAAGTAGTTAPAAPGAGGATSFAGAGFTTVTAAGGIVSLTSTTSNPVFGNKGGGATGGDLNATGSDGGNGGSTSVFGYDGGFGGGAPNGGGTNTTANGVGVAGYAPGGGASGAGTGGSGTTAQDGAAGAAGLCIVRW